MLMKLKAIHSDNDNYTSQGAQTLHDALKSKEVQATAQVFANAETEANQWDIYDSYQVVQLKDKQATGLKDGELDLIPITASLQSSSTRLGRSNSSRLGGSHVASESSMFIEEEMDAMKSSIANLMKGPQSDYNASGASLKPDEKDIGLLGVIRCNPDQTRVASSLPRSG